MGGVIRTAMRTHATDDADTEGPQEHVLTASGEFDVHDEPIDLAIYRFEDWIAFAFFWLLAPAIFYQFFTRYALNDSAGWTEEIARYLLICTVFIGAAISVRKNNHIQVDFLYRLLPKRLMRVLSMFVDVARIALLRLLRPGSRISLMQQDRQPAHGGRRSADRHRVRFVVLAGFALMTWRAIEVARYNWKRGVSVLERPNSTRCDTAPALPEGGAVRRWARAHSSCCFSA